jgi:hypothetical protein
VPAAGRTAALSREADRRPVNAAVPGTERAVCETVAGSEPHRFARTREPDPESDEVVPRAAADDGERRRPRPPRSPERGVRAARTGPRGRREPERERPRGASEQLDAVARAHDRMGALGEDLLALARGRR